jgi:hypothetical protein
MSRFDELVQSLRESLGESSGLTSDDVDVDILSDAMARYLSNDAEWAKYAFRDPNRGYTRNLVDDGNGKSNLVSHARCADLTDVPVLPGAIIHVLTERCNSSSSSGRRVKAVPSTTTATPIAS